MKGRLEFTMRTAAKTGAIMSLLVITLLGMLVFSSSSLLFLVPGPNSSYVHRDCSSSTNLPNQCDSLSQHILSLITERNTNPPENLSALSCPNPYNKEPGRVLGTEVDKVWNMTTGRQEIITAVLGSGIKWDSYQDMEELARMFYLNPGELPLPLGADTWDKNRDGIFNEIGRASCRERV